MTLPARPPSLAAGFRTRFAPSPTGYLHLGHVVNAIWTWAVARAWGGRVLLRIEDHDRTRCRPEYEAALREDLAWLDFEADSEVPAQSAREARYAEVLAGLRDRGLAYVCQCSRKDIAGVSGNEFNVETPYPGTCRGLDLEPGPGRGWRVVMTPGQEAFMDLRRGPMMQDPASQCGDLLVQDRLGQWTYQFAVAVDDTDQQVDLVVRGDDLLSSTGRQVRLARLMGRGQMPIFLHHPLIYKEAGAKLSKADGDTGVRALRAAGRSPSDVLALASSLIRNNGTAVPLPTAPPESAQDERPK